MDVPISPRAHPDPFQTKSPREAGTRPWGWLVLLVLAVGLPLAHLTFGQGVTPPSAPVATASVATTGNYLTIHGEVHGPGRYAFTPQDNLTVVGAVLRAGGLTPKAKDKAVKVIRKVPGKGNVTFVVNLRDVMTRGMLHKDIPILPSDVIIVEEKLIHF